MKMEILTANELISGAAVYFLVDGDWGADIDRARVFSDGETTEQDQVIARAEACGVLISVESETVRVGGGRVVAHRLRERIRAEGPTAPRHRPQKPDIHHTGAFAYVSL